MQHKYYAGAGMAFNSYRNYDDATGFQVLGGYCLDYNFHNPKMKTSAEVGYLTSGDFERSFNRFGNNPNRPPQTISESTSFNGVWVNGLAEYKMDGKIHLMARLGADLGDDNGLMAGAGFGFNLTKFAQFRGEYVVRDNVDSVQINLITEF